ncbi:unnamed protein product [marine sediment metagenome]|uniref:YopX protein domain-containing protein n=1 Tax=marine sediment metagenome TaxID=412755 RepID=X1CIL0_9ZZZZ
MRPIEFRAWDIKRKKMIYYDEDCSSPDMTLNGVLISHDKQSNVSAQYKLMQFTGLKDKNGKEIYDSDILITHKGRRPQIVFWQTDIGQWRTGYAGRKTQFDKTDTLMFASHFEVIGNIHENPELLERE